jgi:hypothetical protein
MALGITMAAEDSRHYIFEIRTLPTKRVILPTARKS